MYHSNTDIVQYPKRTWSNLNALRLFNSHIKKRISPLLITTTTGNKKQLTTETILTSPQHAYDSYYNDTESIISTPSLTASSFSSIMVDNNPLLLVESIRSKQKPAKSQTCPDLFTTAAPTMFSTSSATLELCSPYTMFKQNATYKMTRAATKGQIQLKRAATWLVGLATTSHKVATVAQHQKIAVTEHLSFAESTKKEGESLCSSISSSNYSIQQEQTKPSVELVYGTDMDHVNYIKQQIERNASHHVSKVPMTKRVMYCKVMKIIHLGSSRDCEYELQVQLNDTTISTKRGTLRKVEKGVSADRPYNEPLGFEIEEPFSLNFIVAARPTTNNTKFREGLTKLLGIHWTTTSTLPIVGSSCLNFENKMDVLEQGVSRVKLTKKTGTHMNIELLISVEVKDGNIMREASQSNTMNSLRHCQQGDYLTIYTKTSTYPAWNRYWAVLKDHQLNLYDFCFKDTQEPVSRISLSAMKTVGKPTEDDCDVIGMSRSSGIVCNFDPMNEHGLEGKMYIYADTESNAVYWRRGLNAGHDNQECYVDLRFIW